MSTTDDILALAEVYAEAETQFWIAQSKPVNQVYTEQRIKRNEARAALLKAVEEMAADAARYRWLRLNYDDSLVMYGDNSHCEMMMTEELDRAVDSAMQKETP